MAGNSRKPRFVSAPPRTYLRLLLNILLIALDVSALVGAFMLSYTGRLSGAVFGPAERMVEFDLYIPTLALHCSLILVMFYLSRMYHLPRVVSRIDQSRKIVGLVTVGALIAWSLQDILFKGTAFEVDYSRGMFLFAWLLSALFVVTTRELYSVLRLQLRRWKVLRDNLLIIGNGPIAKDISKRIQARSDLGYNPLGVVVNGTTTKATGHVENIPVIGIYADLPRLIDQEGIEQVIIALPDSQRHEILELVSLCRRGQVDIKIYPDMFAYVAGDLNVDDLGGAPLLTVRDIALRGWMLSLKRGLDIFGSAIGLVLLSPVMLLTALSIRMESDGPVFYTQERMGVDARPFHMIKFRSMRQDAEKNGPGWTVQDDDRVTRLGRFLRKTNWDEIPQLINVLLGQMSLVGPRPERPVYVNEFQQQIPRYMERHREKAGMTGWAQVNGLRGDTSIEERTLYDLWYVENWSLWLDIKIIIRQVLQTVLRRDQNAY